MKCTAGTAGVIEAHIATGFIFGALQELGATQGSALILQVIILVG